MGTENYAPGMTNARKQRLLEVEAVPRPELSPCREIALRAPGCAACAGPVLRTSVEQPALFRHGGYGETRVTTTEVCLDRECSLVRLVAVASARPDRRAA